MSLFLLLPLRKEFLATDKYKYFHAERQANSQTDTAQKDLGKTLYANISFLLNILVGATF